MRPILGAVILAALVSGPLSAESMRNGAILSTEDRFPWATYEQWLEETRRKITFDEAGFRSQYPPERFAQHKETLRLPFTTYEEWLAVLRKRSETMLANWRSLEAETRRAHPPEQFSEFIATVECSRMLYASDGLKIEGFILRPRAATAARYPAIIYNHGGNSGIGGIDDGGLLDLCWLVRAGYVVIASQYRGCGASEGRDEMGGADVADVLNLVPLAESLPYVDPARIGMLGWSRGGMMTYLTLAGTDRVAAAVIGGGPTDLPAEIEKRPAMGALLERSVPGYAEHKEEALRARSAQRWPETICKRTPLLLLQGSDDTRCVPESALEMALELQRLRHPFRLVFFESGSHGLSEHGDEVKRQTLLWFDKYLGRATKTSVLPLCHNSRAVICSGT